jgi:hypothetical protein
MHGEYYAHEQVTLFTNRCLDEKKKKFKYWKSIHRNDKRGQKRSPEIVRIVSVMVFDTTFNNISVISWQSVLLVEETGVPGVNHWPVVSHWQTLSYNVVSNTPLHQRDSHSQL